MLQLLLKIASYDIHFKEEIPILMEKSEETKVYNSPISTWFKILIISWVICQWGLLCHLFLVRTKSYYGIPYLVIFYALIGLVFIFTSIAIAICFFSQSKLAAIAYQIFRYLRGAILLIAAITLLQLIKINVHLFSINGMILYIIIILPAIMTIFVQPIAKEQSLFSRYYNRILEFEKYFNEKTKAIPGWLISALIAILPIIIICAIIYWGFGAKLSDFRPYTWNDQTSYWIWVRSFSKYSFNVGYNVGNEWPAPAAFNHYGEGSPMYVYLYGFIAKLVGWSPQLPILINFCLIAIAIYWFTRALKLDSFQIVLTGLVALLFWPILIFLPTSSQETLNQVIGITLAITFYKLLFRNETVKPHLKLIFILFLLFASITRLSWALLFIPLIFLCSDGKLFRKIILSAIFGPIFILGSILITKYLVPPWGNSILSTLGQVREIGPQVFLTYFSNQIGQLANESNYPSLIVLLELLIILGWSFQKIWKHTRSKPISKDSNIALNIFNAYNVTSIILGGLLVYLVPGYFRVFIPPLLVVVLLQIAEKDFTPVLVLFGISILFLTVPMLQCFDAWKGDFHPIDSQIVQSQDVINENVVFDTTTNNMWCNTLLLPVDNYDYRVMLIPPGIGVSHLSAWLPLPEYPLKSKYLLFDQDFYQTIRDKLHVELLASLPVGDLYYNLDSGCRIK